MWYNNHSETDMELPELPNEMLSVSFLYPQWTFVQGLLVLP